RRFVTRPSKHEQLAAFIKRDLRNQIRGVAESVNAKPMGITGFAIRPVPNQSRAKQRRNIEIVVTLGQMKTKSRISDGELRIATVDVITGEAGAVAKIFPIRSTIKAFAIGPAKPRYPHPIADLEFRICLFTDFFHPADNLMS